jgi:hypothetical protein
MQPPEAGARSIFVDRLHVHVALARPWAAPTISDRKASRGGVAMEDVVLAAFLVVDDELQRDARAAGPARLRRVGAIADHVAGVGVHGASRAPVGGIAPGRRPPAAHDNAASRQSDAEADRHFIEEGRGVVAGFALEIGADEEGQDRSASSMFW